MSGSLRPCQQLRHRQFDDDVGHVCPSVCFGSFDGLNIATFHMSIDTAQ